MRHSGWKTMIFAAMASLGLAAASPMPAAHGDPVRVDRSPMTFRDTGVYANVGFAHGRQPSEDGVASLLSVQRAESKDSPWSFYIFQYNQKDKPPTPQIIEMIRNMAANGKKVILRVSLADKHHGPLDLQKCKDRLNLIFDGGVSPDWVYGITLGEENVYWNNEQQVLPELYHWAKAKWPELMVYQWWTPMEVPNVRVESGWVALPADGWVIDLYLMEKVEFERRLVKALETGKPVIHIVWSSPTWMLYHKGDHTVETWWDGFAKQNFEDQIEVCRGYNVPVAHFATQPGTRKEDGSRGEPIRWAWHATDPRVRQFYNWLETYAMNIAQSPEGSFGQRKLTPELFDWAHTRPQSSEVSFDVDDKQRQVVSMKYQPGQLPRTAGDHALPLPVAQPGVALGLSLADTSALAAVNERWQVANRQGGVNRVEMDFTLTDPQADDLTVTVDVTAQRPLGGSAALAYSYDGKTWSDAVTTDPEAKRPRQTITATIPASARQAGKPMTIRLTLTAGAGVATRAPAVTLHEVRFNRVYRTLTVATANNR